MSNELNSEQEKVENNLVLEIYGPEKKFVAVTAERLEDLAASMARVIEVTVDGERNLNKGNFENEKFGQGTKINFGWFWDLINPEDLLDPVKAEVIQKSFANGALRAIGLAYRDVYVNHLFSVASRCRQLSLPQQKVVIAEMKSMKSPLTYDPFNVVEKEQA